jgi:hypothetical protein
VQLAGYQIEYYHKLHSNLVYDDSSVIVFTGHRGCGKSVIIEEIADAFKDTWKVFLLTGAGKGSPPYYTWYAASQKSVALTRKQLTDISFGISFQPVGLPVGLGLNVGMTLSKVTFNNNEYAILKAIEKTIDQDRVLFLAEDYNSWDQASKELLSKLIAYKSSLFVDKKCVSVVLIDSQIDDKAHLSESFQSDIQEIRIADIPYQDIVEIISRNLCIDSLNIGDLEEIVRFTSYDLRLIGLAVQYEQNSTDSSSSRNLRDLLEKRISQMPESQQQVCRTLECVSIINSHFTEKEAAFLLSREPLYAEKNLDEAVKMYLVRKRQAYDFPNQEIQRFFEEKLNIEKKYLHHKFAQYLQIYHPDDFLGRAHHLFLSDDVGDEDNAKNAAYFLAIEIMRRREITDGDDEAYLQNRLKEITDALPDIFRKRVLVCISAYFEGILLLNRCNYNEAIMKLSEVQYVYASEAFYVDVMRQKLLSMVQLADDLHSIKTLADHIYDIVSSEKFVEDEIWCKTALLLIEVYGNRHVRQDRFDSLKSGFEARVRKHIKLGSFRALYAKYTCKSSLFFNSMVATKLTEDSCEYFRTYNNPLSLYFSLCNNAANRIICGEYDIADKRLRECENIIEDNPNIQFPGTYKVFNNKIIKSFLQSEGKLLDFSSRDRNTILHAAETAIVELEQLISKQGYEVSHVIEFNLLGMYMLCGKNEKANELFLRFEMQYKKLDIFYKYYFHSAGCTRNILDGRFEEAYIHLESMDRLHVVLLANFTKILDKRSQILGQLISERYSGDAFDLNYELIKKGIKVQDPSASFWGRGFLLSDLQFLSI